MANLFESDEEIAAQDAQRREPPGLFDQTDDSDAEAPELTDEEEFDLVEQYIRDCMEELPDRIEIHGQLFMRDGGGLYMNIEDPDDNRIFEFDPETGELCQWPDCD